MTPTGAVDEIERFLTGPVRTAPELDRILATVLFIDLVESTRQLATVGDRGWADLMQRHHAIVRELLKTYRGQEMDTAGDGFFSTLDGRPAGRPPGLRSSPPRG